MFGRKKTGDNLAPADRQRLVEAYRTVLAEIDDVMERCAWFLDETRVSDVPTEYVAPLRDALERELALRGQVVQRIETIPTGTIVIAELAQEIDTIHQATVAADDLMKSAGSAAAAAIMLKDLANKR